MIQVDLISFVLKKTEGRLIVRPTMVFDRNLHTLTIFSLKLFSLVIFLTIITVVGIHFVLPLVTLDHRRLFCA